MTNKPLLDATILQVCAQAGAAKSICPTDAAKAHATRLGEDDLAWRHWLTEVRRRSVILAGEGRLVIYRKGKPVDPTDFRGVYRLGLPRAD
ncbi:MAG: DUF3253 domain-containing protein [Hyphomicrobiales bacterium]|nr:DUF3253 domain-containing protein [Hyphomicrobiales bacterium]MDE2114687.1 DUF3253 domain-containing protein [Hyphomicrobiales bacterium]